MTQADRDRLVALTSGSDRVHPLRSPEIPKKTGFPPSSSDGETYSQNQNTQTSLSQPKKFNGLNTMK